VVARHAYVQDYDVEAAPEHKRVNIDPVPGELLLGTVLDVRPVIARGQIFCEIRVERQSGATPIPTFDANIPGLGKIGLPETTYDTVVTTVAARPGQTLLIARVGVSVPRPAFGDPPAVPPAKVSRSLCVFLRVNTVGGSAGTQPVSLSPTTRLWDVMPLTHPFQTDTGIGPLSLIPGVRSIPDEQATPWMEDTLLVDLVRSGTDPGSWETQGASIGFADHRLRVRNSPAVLDQIGAAIDRMFARRLRKVAGRVSLIAADPNVFESLVREIPGLADGRGQLDRGRVSGLVARAKRNEGLTLLAAGEVAGLDGQCFTFRRENRQAYVRDVDLQIDGAADAPVDPQVDIAEEGFRVTALPVLSEDGSTVRVQLMASWAELDRPLRVAAVRGKANRIHLPTLSTATFEATLHGAVGEPLVAGVKGPLKVDGADRYVLAIVECSTAP
jgi:hypothetical protein